ncbi:late transcription unit A protein [Chlamydia ibidis 10-1398/6]|nr:protein LtuA [Chlamydia ibidis]EQM62432.1 late transcription unit A protein [Chlamydia ibidis 10-1398/6]
MFFIRVRSVGFLDIHGVLSKRKGEQVLKSSASIWCGARGAIFYRLAF